jgi:hypothetical protein
MDRSDTQDERQVRAEISALPAQSMIKLDRQMLTMKHSNSATVVMWDYRKLWAERSMRALTHWHLRRRFAVHV